MAIARVVDFESTGWPPDAALCEIGYTDVTLLPGYSVIHAPVSILCNPKRPIGVEARSIHHISDKMVKNMVDWKVELGLLASRKPDVWVAHNKDFEQKFFNPPGSKWVCTYKVAQQIWASAPKHTNQVLRYWLGIDEKVEGFDPDLADPAHRAGPDTYVTAHLLQAALQHMSIQEMVDVSSKPVILTKVAFGKHKGVDWKDVPSDYLEWVLNNTTFNDENVKATARHHLAERSKPRPQP